MYVINLNYFAPDFPGATVLKNLPISARDARDRSSIPGSGRSSGVGNSN